MNQTALINPFAEEFDMQEDPILTPQQIARIEQFATHRTAEVGEILFDASDLDIPFFLVLSGSIAIVQPLEDEEKKVATRGAGQFTGEMTMISGRRSIFRGRVTEAAELLVVPGDRLRSLISRDAELGELIMAAFVTRRSTLIEGGDGNVVLLGTPDSSNTLALREFLTRNGHPFTYIDLETDSSASDLLRRFSVGMGDIPIVVCNNRHVLRNPSIRELAQCLDLNSNIDQNAVRDLIVIGAGPAGLAAAVYAASEGLSVLVIEKNAPGGQAGSSSKIENYLGFPMGLSGQELANRAIAQAIKFGAKLMVAQTVVHLDCNRKPYRVVLDSGMKFSARAVIIATGAQYARLLIGNIEAFTGRGIHYNATYMEAQLCTSEEVVVVGGGNSAGQAAIFLARTCAHVHIVVRSKRLADSMSQYLVDRIEENPKIDIHYQTEIIGLHGNAHLESIEWRDGKTGAVSSRPIRYVFVMAGASPRTEWLEDCIALDEKGFVLTGSDLHAGTSDTLWPLTRAPHMLETSMPGVFAVGDSRSGNVKRVASAVGEGSIAIHLVHRFLAETADSANSSVVEANKQFAMGKV
jgi:thioredoxin reductase (NADPH)